MSGGNQSAPAVRKPPVIPTIQSLSVSKLNGGNTYTYSIYGYEQDMRNVADHSSQST